MTQRSADESPATRTREESHEKEGARDSQVHLGEVEGRRGSTQILAPMLQLIAYTSLSWPPHQYGIDFKSLLADSNWCPSQQS